MPNHGGLIQAGGQLQIIQPQQLQLPQQQLAQVITPNGQIQLAQIQPAQAANSQTAGLANFTQNANGTITIQVFIEKMFTTPAQKIFYWKCLKTSVPLGFFCRLQMLLMMRQTIM